MFRAPMGTYVATAPHICLKAEFEVSESDVTCAVGADFVVAAAGLSHCKSWSVGEPDQ